MLILPGISPGVYTEKNPEKFCVFFENSMSSTPPPLARPPPPLFVFFWNSLMRKKRGGFSPDPGVLLSSESVTQYICMNLPKPDENDNTFENDENTLP